MSAPVTQLASVGCVILWLTGCAGFDLGTRTKYDDPVARAPAAPSDAVGSPNATPDTQTQTIETSDYEHAERIMTERCSFGHVATDISDVAAKKCPPRNAVLTSRRCEAVADVRVHFHCLGGPGEPPESNPHR